jgi:xanthine dehydrogenase small subunit
MLIALGAGLKLTRSDGSGAREAAIENFFLGYKKLDLGEGEIISAILLSSGPRIPGSSLKFNFEKASKRERLDIAAVNSAALFELDGESRIARARISAGGVAPVPRLLEKTSAFLIGKRIAQGEALEIARAAARMAAEEVSPISDIRGSADYRARVLERLVLAHFIELFPGAGVEEAIA